MIEVFRTLEFWFVLAVVAVLIVGMGILKKYLKKIAFGCDKKSEKRRGDKS